MVETTNQICLYFFEPPSEETLGCIAKCPGSPFLEYQAWGWLHFPWAPSRLMRIAALGENRVCALGFVTARGPKCAYKLAWNLKPSKNGIKVVSTIGVGMCWPGLARFFALILSFFFKILTPAHVPILFSSIFETYYLISNLIQYLARYSPAI